MDMSGLIQHVLAHLAIRNLIINGLIYNMCAHLELIDLVADMIIHVFVHLVLSATASLAPTKHIHDKLTDVADFKMRKIRSVSRLFPSTMISAQVKEVDRDKLDI
jgi:hypothetical protein